jgi:serine/threonine protein kinase
VPRTLGRYQVLRELGRGAQGAVYLATDSELGRQVAIKTLARARDAERDAALLAEARTTAKLTHPNIVTLYDAFEDSGTRCVVLEYVAGDTVESIIRRDGPLAVQRAIGLASQVLDGLAYAHEQGIVHRDIKPANILVDQSGAARIMDFGIAVSASNAATHSPAGTPRYMAPEALDSREIARTADVFSVGMTLYEALTGRPAVAGRNVFEVLHKVANETFAPPSSLNPEVDEALDQIVMRALTKDPSGRYTDAREMRLALEHFCERRASTDAGDHSHSQDGSTVDFLLKRMRHKSSFPALSQTIGAINRATRADSQSVQTLSEVLLKDFALTNRLLRLVNSSGYGQFGGSISTISRAVLILGFDAVRDLAVTLVLFEHLQNKGQAAKLRDAVSSALLTGILTRHIARAAGIRNTEESFICGVFHNLGRLLTDFYLYDESVEIARLMQQANTTEAAAVKSVLGASYEEIGTAIARNWNLPGNIVAAMQRLPEGKLEKPKDHGARLRLIVAAAADVNTAAASGSTASRDVRLKQVAARFAEVLAVDHKQLTMVCQAAVEELLGDAASLLGDSRTGKFCQSLRQTSGAVESVADRDTDPLANVIEHAGVASTHAEQLQTDPTQVLTAGVQDITNTLVGDFNLSDLLRIILETMYRAMGFQRVMLFMRDTRTATLTARFGFGAGLDQLIGRLCIPLTKDQDVFSVVLAKNVDILISDIDAENIRTRIPDWYRKSALGATFVLLPIAVDGRTIGLFYGDKSSAGELAIEPSTMNLLKTLRNQAVLAIRTRK